MVACGHSHPVYLRLVARGTPWQNALARASKVRAARAEHEAEIEAERKSYTPWAYRRATTWLINAHPQPDLRKLDESEEFAASLSWRVAIRRQCLILLKNRSTKLRAR